MQVTHPSKRKLGNRAGQGLFTKVLQWIGWAVRLPSLLGDLVKAMSDSRLAPGNLLNTVSPSAAEGVGGRCSRFLGTDVDGVSAGFLPSDGERDSWRRDRNVKMIFQATVWQSSYLTRDFSQNGQLWSRGLPITMIQKHLKWWRIFKIGFYWFIKNK